MQALGRELRGCEGLKEFVLFDVGRVLADEVYGLLVV